MESIDIDTRESIEREFQRFISNNELSEYTFTSYFTAPERIYIHNKAKWLDIMSKSRGKGMNRRVTIYKQNRSSIIQRDATFELSLQSHRMIASLLDQVPLTSPHNVLPLSEPDRSVTPGLIQRRNVNRLMHGVPIVPGMIQRQWVQGGNNVAAIRQMLPIHALRDPIVQTIDDYQVVIISGEKGCGKTTQVPQYIMEQHALMDRPCRIVCSQPRRIAAVAMAERVALERNCRLGTEVGFQVRHESLASDTSALTCITNEMLLHTLMGGDSTLATVTHLILDDIHIRDRESAFILVAVREALLKYRSLRLILISDSLDTAVFSRFFNNCPVVTVLRRLYEVKHYFLEDVLKWMNYRPNQTEKHRNETKKRLLQDQQAKEQTGDSSPSPPFHSEPEPEEMIDSYLENAAKSGDVESFQHILNMIKNNGVSVDHQHAITGITALMAASIHGQYEIAEELLLMGARVDLAINHNKTALYFARKFGHPKIVDLLTLYQNDVNADLILAIIDRIQSSNQYGDILIFLPGYEEIVSMMDKLGKRRVKPNEVQMVPVALHSKMDTREQYRVLKPAPYRKVILSTNLAESWIMLHNVVFVIDTGLVRGGEIGVGARTEPCSQLCVRQRSACAGRTPAGVCYHLFSSSDYKRMAPERQPEILRTPLQNFCLQTKLLAQGNIADFMAQTLDPPSSTVVDDAVNFLKTIDALGQYEEVTLLGLYLVDMPIAPHLGKALIYAVLLNCLDPVLTVVAMLSYDDPFVAASSDSARSHELLVRRFMGGLSQSDHCGLLRVYMRWLEACSRGQGRAFCDGNRLSEARLKLVYTHRQQLLTQLRSTGLVRNYAGAMRDLNANSESLTVVKAALTAGHYPNLARVDRQMNAIRTRDEVSVTFHPSSLLRCDEPQDFPAKLATEWVVFEEKREGELRVCSLITDITVALFAGPARLPRDCFIKPEDTDGDDSDSATFQMDDWLVFQLEPYVVPLVIRMRSMWHALLQKRLRYPHQRLSRNDEAVIEALVAVLRSQEEEAGLQQPRGIGAKPPNPLESLDLQFA